MKKLFLFLIILLTACSSEPPFFFGDIGELPEGNEIRIQGMLKKNLSKTGSYEYRLNGVWLTFDDDRVSADDFIGKTVIVKGTVHHFNNCPSRSGETSGAERRDQQSWARSEALRDRNLVGEISVEESVVPIAKQDPDMPEQCAIAEQLLVKELR